MTENAEIFDFMINNFYEEDKERLDKEYGDFNGFRERILDIAAQDQELDMIEESGQDFKTVEQLLESYKEE